MSAFVGELIVKLVMDDESGMWEHMDDQFGFQSDLAKQTFMIPKGATSDFCSVPRVPLAYDMLGNRARKSGAVHDQLYKSHIVPRETADQVLREMLLLDGVGHFEAQEFYLAVRMFGGSHWGPDPAPKAN